MQDKNLFSHRQRTYLAATIAWSGAFCFIFGFAVFWFNNQIGQKLISTTFILFILADGIDPDAPIVPWGFKIYTAFLSLVMLWSR